MTQKNYINLEEKHLKSLISFFTKTLFLLNDKKCKWNNEIKNINGLYIYFKSFG